MNLLNFGIVRRHNKLLEKHYGDDRSKHYYSMILSAIFIGCALLLLVFPISAKVLFPDQFDYSTRLVFLPIEIGLMVLCVAADLFLLRGHYNIARDIFTAASVIATLGSMLLTGGFPNSVVVPCLTLLPVIGYLLYGSRIGTIMTFGIAAFIGLQWAIVSNMDITLPDYTSGANPTLNSVVVFFIAFAAILTCVAFYQKQNKKIWDELVQEKDNLDRLANLDPLTGLFNPRYFYNELEQIGDYGASGPSKFAVLFMDLDDFKPVNDNYGHRTGDSILQSVANMLRQCAGEDTVVARMGGDEFAILMTNVADESAVQKLRAELRETLFRPIDLEGVEHSIGVSIGYALYPDDAANPQQLLQSADQDMYRDKLQKYARHELQTVRNNVVGAAA